VIPRFYIVCEETEKRFEHILGLAEADPFILLLDRKQYGRTLVFCASKRMASAQRLRYLSGHLISGGLCTLTLVPNGRIAVQASGSDESSARLERFVGRILRDLGPFRVFDEETGDDLTSAAIRSPRMLFAS
jgi:hypothetical protein